MLIVDHWNPLQDYCIKCGEYVGRGVYKTLVLRCICYSIPEREHGISRPIHNKCLQEVKDALGKEKIFVYELFEYLGIKEPVT